MSGAAGRFSGRAGTVALVLIGLGVAAGVWGPALRAHEVATRSRFADDVCQHVAPFLQAAPAGAGEARGYIDRYWRACLPPGFRALYGIGGRWVSPRTISHALPFALLAVLAGALAAGGARFGGVPAAVGCGLLALGSEMFFSRMEGGLPRAFAFPLVALMANFAVRGQVRWLAGTVCAAFAFYPAVGVAGLLALGLVLLLPAQDRGEAAGWSWRKRAVGLALAGGLCVGLVAPNFAALRPYGAGIAPRDYAEFPEAASGGRLGGADRSDFRMSPVQCAREFAPDAFVHSHSPWRKALGLPRLPDSTRVLLWLEVLLAGVALPGLARDAAGRRLIVLTAAVGAAYGISLVMTPALFMPERHVAYAVPVLTVLWLAAAASALPRVGKKRGGWCALGLAALSLLFLGGTPKPGQATVAVHDGRLYEFLATLPEESFIAGWPNWMSPVPVLCGRAVLVSYETHLPYHRAYAEEMRRRMRDLVAAYFADDAAALRELRERYGVTHLVVEAGHLQRAPVYFNPFGAEIRQAFAAGQAGGFEVLRQRGGAGVVYDDGERFVIDLGRVSD